MSPFLCWLFFIPRRWVSYSIQSSYLDLVSSAGIRSDTDLFFFFFFFYFFYSFFLHVHRISGTVPLLLFSFQRIHCEFMLDMGFIITCLQADGR